jgi:cyclophilin family peptidyl-prolyl cis-trans isomerase
VSLNGIFQLISGVAGGINSRIMNQFNIHFSSLFNFFQAGRWFLLLFVSCTLLGCGGSSEFPPVVTGIKPQSLSYGRLATIYIGGKDLRSSMVVETNGNCTNPTFASSSSTDLLVLNCQARVVGDFPLVVKSAEGAVIYTSTLTVPKPQVTLITANGGISFELNQALAPVTVDNFLTYVAKGYYSNTLFHRVIPGFVAQGGGYTSGMVKKAGQLAPIVLESNNGLSNVRASVAMARTNVANSATSEFFINLVDNLSLDYKNSGSPGYAVFGSVVQGMALVDAMAQQPTGVVNGFADVPLSEILISMVLQTQ